MGTYRTKFNRGDMVQHRRLGVGEIVDVRTCHANAGNYRVMFHETRKRLWVRRVDLSALAGMISKWQDPVADVPPPTEV